MIQQWHPGLQRHRHAGLVRILEDVVQQKRLYVDVEHAGPVIGKWAPLEELAQDLARSNRWRSRHQQRFGSLVHVIGPIGEPLDQIAVPTKEKLLEATEPHVVVTIWNSREAAANRAQKRGRNTSDSVRQLLGAVAWIAGEQLVAAGAAQCHRDVL